MSRSTSVVVSGLDSSTLLHSSCWLVTALQTRTQSTLAPSTQPAKRKRPSSPTSASSKRPAVATPSTQLEQLHLSHDNDMGNQEATRLYGQLTSEWANGAGDQAKIRSLLAQLKVSGLTCACSGKLGASASSGSICRGSSLVRRVDECVWQGSRHALLSAVMEGGVLAKGIRVTRKGARGSLEASEGPSRMPLLSRLQSALQNRLYTSHATRRNLS